MEFNNVNSNGENVISNCNLLLLFFFFFFFFFFFLLFKIVNLEFKMKLQSIFLFGTFPSAYKT